MTKTSTERSRKKRLLDAAGETFHVKGDILVEDKPKFDAMLWRALPAVQRATEGEAE